MSDQGTYGHSNAKGSEIVAAPDLAYLPQLPKSYRPKIALIGCGGISEYHLRNYKALGLDVVALCSRDADKAKARAREFYPDARIFTDYHELINTSGADVIDAATDPLPRVDIIISAVRAGKHVLSQKPFVQDLEVGRELVALADEHNVRLAVNQNGRWAPHFSYMTQCIQTGIMGKLSSIDFSLQWDHRWIEATPFNEIHHLILSDFAIHWFDILNVFMGEERAKQVTATVNKAPIRVNLRQNRS